MRTFKKVAFLKLTDQSRPSPFPGIQINGALTFFLIMLLSLSLMGSKVLAEEKMITEISHDTMDWLFGKIEPIVSQESQTNDYLNVIVYIKGPECHIQGCQSTLSTADRNPFRTHTGYLQKI